MLNNDSQGPELSRSAAFTSPIAYSPLPMPVWLWLMEFAPSRSASPAPLCTWKKKKQSKQARSIRSCCVTTVYKLKLTVASSHTANSNVRRASWLRIRCRLLCPLSVCCIIEQLLGLTAAYATYHNHGILELKAHSHGICCTELIITFSCQTVMRMASWQDFV